MHHVNSFHVIYFMHIHFITFIPLIQMQAVLICNAFNIGKLHKSNLIMYLSHENFGIKCKCQIDGFNGLFEMFSNMTKIWTCPWKLLLKHVSLSKHNKRTKASSSFNSIFILAALIYILNNKFQSLNIIN